MAKGTTNIGYGIALQGTPETYTPYVLRSMQQQRDEEEAARARSYALRMKALEEQDEYRDQIDKWVLKNESGIGRVHQPTIQTKAAKLFDIMQRIRSENPTSYNYRNNREFKNALFELQQEYDRAQQSTAQFAKDLSILNQDKGNNLSTKEIQLPDGRKTTLLDAWQKGEPEEWNQVLQAIHGDAYGGEYYTFGLFDTKPDIIDWRKDLRTRAKMVGTYTTKEGEKGPVSQYKNTQFLDFMKTPAYNAAIAEYIAAGNKLEDAPESIERFWNSLFSSKAAPEREEGAGIQIGIGGIKSGKYYYNFANPKEGFETQRGKRLIIFGQEGGTPLPINSFESESGYEITGRPTGKIYDMGGENETNYMMEVLVPKNKEQDVWALFSETSPESMPDKYKKEYVPITKSDINKKKFMGEYGGVDIDELHKQIGGGAQVGAQDKIDEKTDSNGGYTNVKLVIDAKGNEIKIGVKNGKWYNIKTGKEL